MSTHKHSHGLAKPGILYPIYIDHCLDHIQLWLKYPSCVLLIYWEAYLVPLHSHYSYPKGFLVKPHCPMNHLEQSYADHYEEYIEKAKKILIKEML